VTATAEKIRSQKQHMWNQNLLHWKKWLRTW